MSTSYQVADGIAVITLENPPVNGLGQSTRAGIVDGINKAQADASVQAVVITGSGKVFCGGADIREFGSPAASAAPDLHVTIAAVEQSTKPVVAAIHGVVMGGGLELALGCHYRVAASGTQVALPEVNIGLVPGAGGTQRLPRVLGVEAALEMITTGVSVLSEKLILAPGQKLFSQLVDGDLLAGAKIFAKQIAAARPLPSVRDHKVSAPADPELFTKTRAALAKTRRNLEAPQRCVDCVEASVSLTDLDAGIKFERDVFERLLNSDQARALRHAFFGERAASKIPDVPADTPLRDIKQVAVIGAGTMGGGIAMCFLNAGVPVVMLEMKQEAIDRGLGIIRKNYEAQVSKGKLAQAKYEQRMALLSTTLSYDDIAQADMVIEAVFEDLGVKSQVFAKLDEVMKPGAILASNTSTLDVDKIAEVTKRPSDVVGLHFFSPANVMRLLEVVRSKHTAKDVMATVMAVAKKIKKVAVVSGVCDGFIGNRMFEQYTRQAGFLIEEGATPEQVDKAAEKFGMAMGPFRVGDLAGNDIGWAIRKRRYVEKPNMRYSKVADLICEVGRFGQKAGKGWYDYEVGKREPVPSTEVLAILDKFRQDNGITPREISDEEIVSRLVLSLTNEGAKILEEGIANRASDLDMVYLTGYGFPIYRGGPMLYADMIGLPAVIEKMKAFQQNPHDDAAFWEPAPLLAKLAAEGKNFTGQA
ncbi:3-hydroxyacyl-CoA dehydrogenase NAD-binding domain-containing protein [Aquabacterium sp. CECT 9606]|uniref:3-hydroxyacyl-CoA dehydrogenase NAD-binding domain-containing protein n=1 Tax=Aquabacterium sp. CECT 9606 TaxID=2845822 RepID=UPI001E578FB5|nr:3-hydroxyacyl-CoA dehydrogenase NAD-binding domain-containing protein [Aquabacterium sp. CECT 9606]CAH0349138.1 Fatty acid oxidation complex subunit alpha [Aquabacterium sp. CECT 9606]